MKTVFEFAHSNLQRHFNFNDRSPFCSVVIVPLRAVCISDGIRSFESVFEVFYIPVRSRAMYFLFEVETSIDFASDATNTFFATVLVF